MAILQVLKKDPSLSLSCFVDIFYCFAFKNLIFPASAHTCTTTLWMGKEGSLSECGAVVAVCGRVWQCDGHGGKVFGRVWPCVVVVTLFLVGFQFFLPCSQQIYSGGGDSGDVISGAAMKQPIYEGEEVMTGEAKKK